MYEVSDQLYLEIAAQLMDEIGKREFFAGTVVHVEEEVECRLRCTLFIEHTNDAERGSRVKRITPVWWEFHTTEGSVERLNDFSFSTLMELSLGKE